jgi:class 3 adenylate cyclase
VLVEGDDLLGDGVNIAARLEGMAEPSGICLSEDAFRQVRGKVDTEFADLGKQSLKTERSYTPVGMGSDEGCRSARVPCYAIANTECGSN